MSQILKLEEDIKKINENIEPNRDKIIELYKEIITIRRGIRNKKKRNKNYNDLSLRIAELKNDIRHYKNDTIMLNNRILEFESLKQLARDKLIEEIALLEHRLEVVSKKKSNTTNQKQLDVLNYSKNELNDRLQNKIIELNNVNQRIRDIERYGETNPFDFSDIKQDDEIDLKKFLDIVEHNVVIFENDSIHEVFKIIKDGYPFILKGEIRINDNNPSMINAFFKDAQQLDKRIEKINDKYDETLNITFTGELIRYTKTFNKIKRSNYGTGCDSFKKIVEYRGNLCYIPEENECFRKCLEFIYKKDFSQQYCDFIKESQRNKNIMTSAKYNLSVKNTTSILLFMI